jgi:hypothetical protein
MHYVRFPGLKIDRTTLLKEDKRSIPLLLSEEGILMSAIDHGSIKQVVSGFSLDNSSLGSDVVFPVFIVNSLKWILGDGLKMARWNRTGDFFQIPSVRIKRVVTDKMKAEFSLTDFSSLNSQTAVLKGVCNGNSNRVDSFKVNLPVDEIKSKIDRFDKIGIYSVELKNRTTTGYNERYPVSILDSGESDLRRTSLSGSSLPDVFSFSLKNNGQGSSKMGNKEQWSGKEYYSWFAKAFLFILLFEWFLFSRNGG